MKETIWFYVKIFMLIFIAGVTQFVMGYRAQAQGWRYSCPGASWSMGVIEVEHKPGEKIHAELGLCPDGVVLWRPANQIYSPSK